MISLFIGPTEGEETLLLNKETPFLFPSPSSLPHFHSPQKSPDFMNPLFSCARLYFISWFLCVFVRASVCAPDKEEVRLEREKQKLFPSRLKIRVFCITYETSEPSVKSFESCQRGSSWRASATSSINSATKRFVINLSKTRMCLQRGGKCKKQITAALSELKCAAAQILGLKGHSLHLH